MIKNDINNYKENLKSIRDYWVNNPCEEWFFGPGINCKNPNQINLEEFNRNSFLRYSNEPEILKFTDFNLLKGLNVLEVGYGLGSDAVLLAKSSKNYFGTDHIRGLMEDKILKIFDRLNHSSKRHFLLF